MDVGTGSGAVQKQSLVQALAEAFGHRSYVLLVIGFFTCGFQLLFITVHLPAYLVDRGLSVDAGAWTIGTIGLFNIIGSITAGWLMAPHAEALPAVVPLHAAFARRAGVHHAAGDDGFCHRVRRDSWACFGFRPCRPRRRWWR